MKKYFYKIRKIDLKKNIKDNMAFSLVETIIYVALLAIILTVIIDSILVMSNAYRSVTVTRNIEDTALISMDRMTREIRNASSIDETQTVYNNDHGAIFLNSIDASNTPTSIKFYLSGQRILIDENGTYLGPITSSNVLVDSLYFRPIVSSSSVGIKIEMVLESGTGQYLKKVNFYDTVVLRGSY